MSDFKFACPGCGQKISANDDYVGYQITCPSCNASIVVPGNPTAAASPSISMAGAPGQPPPPTPPKAARLSVSALASESHGTPAAAPAAAPAASHASGPEDQGSAAYRAMAARKPKKDYTNLIASIVAIVLVGGGAYLGRDWLGQKWKAIRGPTKAEIAAAEAAKIPPKPPELTASEVMNKVFALYKTIPQFTSTGKSIAALDMSAVQPSLKGLPPQTISLDLNLKMSRPLNFRIDEILAIPTISGTPTNFTRTGWSTGNGYFMQANNARTKLQSEKQLFSTFSSGVSVGPGDIIRLFNDESADGLAQADVEWTRNTDENLNGQACYVMAGTVKTEGVLLWVSRDSFLIMQTQLKLDGISGIATMTDDQLKAELKTELGREPSLLETATAKKMAKVTGTVTDTYGNIQTNGNLAITEFTPAAPAARGAGANGQQAQQPPGSRAAQIVGGRRRGK